MTGPNGSYTVTNASVACDWDRNQIISPGVVYAVIGANFFDQVPILFDPTRNRLGIGQPTTSPVTWPAIPRNCGH